MPGHRDPLDLFSAAQRQEDQRDPNAEEPQIGCHNFQAAEPERLLLGCVDQLKGGDDVDEGGNDKGCAAAQQNETQGLRGKGRGEGLPTGVITPYRVSRPRAAR